MNLWIAYNVITDGPTHVFENLDANAMHNTALCGQKYATTVIKYDPNAPIDCAKCRQLAEERQQKGDQP